MLSRTRPGRHLDPGRDPFGGHEIRKLGISFHLVHVADDEMHARRPSLDGREDIEFSPNHLGGPTDILRDFLEQR